MKFVCLPYPFAGIKRISHRAAKQKPNYVRNVERLQRHKAYHPTRMMPGQDLLDS